MPTTRHALVGPAHRWRIKREFQIRFRNHVGFEHCNRALTDGGTFDRRRPPPPATQSWVKRRAACICPAEETADTRHHTGNRV